MRIRTQALLVPFVASVLAASVLAHVSSEWRTSSTAHACDCDPGAIWVLEGVEVEGKALPWPREGQLYPGRLALWAEGLSIDVEYAP